MDVSKSLRIRTLGCFMISDLEISYLKPRSEKLWILFKYLLTNKNKSITVDNILEDLFSEEDYENPKNAIQNMIYRLRKLLHVTLRMDGYDIRIQYIDGCYKLNTNNIEIDTDNFELLMRKGDSFKDNDSLKAIRCYKEAFNIYKGEYLPEINQGNWILPVRNYYKRLYVQLFSKLYGLLKDNNMRNELALYCEKALLVEPYEEELHVDFLKVLISEGKINQAYQHYEYITSTLYTQFGIKPTDEMRDVYKNLIKATNNITMSLESIKVVLSEDTIVSGAYLCDPTVFRSIYFIHQRRSERQEDQAYLVLVEHLNSMLVASDKIVSTELLNTLLDGLRKGDVITNWNDHQILILLSGVKTDAINNVIRRLKGLLNKNKKLESLRIFIEYQPVLESGDITLFDRPQV